MTEGPENQSDSLAADGLDPVIVRSGEGRSRLWGRGSLVTKKLAAEQTGGAIGITHFSAVSQERGPRHIHTLEDEIFLVVDGLVDVSVGEYAETVHGSSILFLPRGVPHSYRVVSETAEFYVITTPGGFERFFAEVGYPPGMRDAAPVGRRWSVSRTQELANELGVGLIWCE